MARTVGAEVSFYLILTRLLSVYLLPRARFEHILDESKLASFPPCNW